MGVFAKFAACACAAAALVAPGVAGPALQARPAFGGMHPTIVTRGPRMPYSGIAPTIVSRGPRAGYAGYRGIRPTLVSRYRRGYGYGYGGGWGLGYDGYEASDLGAGAGYPPAPESFGEPPPPLAFPAPPPACPLIIKVGRGLDHPVKTQVVYGRPFCRP